MDGKQWSACIWDGGKRAWESGWHESPVGAMDEADSALDRLDNGR